MLNFVRVTDPNVTRFEEKYFKSLNQNRFSDQFTNRIEYNDVFVDSLNVLRSKNYFQTMDAKYVEKKNKLQKKHYYLAYNFPLANNRFAQDGKVTWEEYSDPNQQMGYLKHGVHAITGTMAWCLWDNLGGITFTDSWRQYLDHTDVLIGFVYTRKPNSRAKCLVGFQKWLFGMLIYHGTPDQLKELNPNPIRIRWLFDAQTTNAKFCVEHNNKNYYQIQEQCIQFSKINKRQIIPLK